jgi:hypothetical protein
MEVEPSSESVAAEIASLWVNIRELSGRVRTLEKALDTKSSPWWRRLWWRIDGWPAWYQVGSRSWRPWHR